LKANGNNNTVAVIHRKKFVLIGGTLPEMPRAITKLPDQTIVDTTARLTPIYKFLFPAGMN